MKLVIDIAAKNSGRLESAAVTSITNTTVVSALPDLELADNEPIDITFTDSSASPVASPSWAGAAGYTLAVSLGTLDINGLQAMTSTTSFVPQTGGWTGSLALNTQFLIDAVAMQVGYSVDMARFPGGLRPPGPIQGLPRNGWFYVQIQVIDPSSNAITYALLRLRVFNRVRPQSVGTDAGDTAAVYAWILANAVLNVGSITALTGGSTFCLDGYSDTTLPTGCIIMLSYSNVSQIWKLELSTATTDVTATPARVRAKNYSSLNRVWYQIG